ncbi:carboxypeptidase regulatory-like domain-containing protein [Candidatus Roizmanbacteria bacterium]|nr:carboxypeptidase regulatory-like domain-containing protein [Candidatus Roizmanbacteria bacterium]
MFKKFLALFLVLFTFSTPLVNVSAQGATPIFTPFCFVSTICSAAGSGCSNGDGHRARLTVEPGKGPQPNSKVYVVVAVAAADGQHYTSGNSDIDARLSYPPMPGDLGYRFEGLYRGDGTTPINQTLTNTLTSNASGDLSVAALEWQDYTPQGHERRFLGISEEQPQPTIDPGLGLGAQQQAEIPKLDWATALANCIPLSWDPDGIVFDSQSLEPIPGTSVTLLKKRADGIFSFVNKFDPNDVPNGILTNPYSTIEDGGFSFFVPDGIYKLIPQITGYNFPGSLTLNSNYSKIYSNIYPLTTGVEIVEKGGPQHRDIPVDSVGGQPTYFPIKIIEYNYQSDRISSVFIDGRVSHPLSTINAYSVIPDPNSPDAKVRYKLIKTVQADKVGRFSIIVNQSTFNKTKSEMFGEIEAIKADFGGTSTDTNPTPAVLKLNPILTYIEGSASDKGQVLPGAKVELLLDSSTKPYYETVADSQGYFKVPSDYIPFMPYKLRYSLGGTVASVTTSKFITDNSTNINSNKTNLFYPQYSNPKINESIKKSIAAYNNQPPPNQQSDVRTNQPASKNLTFLGITLFIVILLTAVGVLGVYLIKKNQNTPTI